jgi:hypothetical protein
MGVPRTLTGIFAGALAVPVLLTACGGGDNSVADPPISPAPTSSPTQSPEHETAEQFVRRFVSVSNAMEAHGKTDAYLALTQRCKPCRALAKQIESARSHGGFYRSDGWSVKSIRPSVGRRSGTVDIDVRSAPTSFRNSAGSSVEHYTGGNFTFRIALRRSGSEWKVTNVAQVAT